VTTEDIKNAQSNIEANKEKEQEAAAAISGHERNIAKYDEKSQFLRKSAGQKTQAAQTNLLEAQTDLMKVEKERRDGMQRIAQLETDVRSEERATEEEQEKIRAETENMIKEYKKMESPVLAHQEGFRKQLTA